MRSARFPLFAAVAALAAAVASARGLQLADTFDDLVREPAIGYFASPTTDAVARLKQDVEQGAAPLVFDGEQGYLRSVLRALALPIESQILVYSKSSVQAVKINPQNPRALYFDDRVAVGYIRGADYLEFAAHDPKQGVVFYTLDQRASAAPNIERRDFCLSCHYSYATLAVPGMLVRSIVTSPGGMTLPQLGNYVTDHRSPLAERWGGYYVTGTHGSERHLGNALVDRDHPDDAAAGAQNVTSLRGRFDLDAYPSPHSDITALLVFEHQMRMMNLLTRAAWEVRVAAAKGGDVAARARMAAIEVVDYLLFVDEAPLPAQVQGTSGFAALFSAKGPRDRKGRSLRELALNGRLMRYPCSYMIYSEAFDALPPEAKRAIYERLGRVLSHETSGKYARLSAADRAAVCEILHDTKPDLPAGFE